MTKHAATDHPIHSLLAARWSPYAFADTPVERDELRSLFEAARWAASSYNEQPWSFVVATREDEPAYEKLLSCLLPGNQAWAKAAPVLALGIVRDTFTRNEKENAAALHDLGLATGNLLMEATARGLHVHPMIGIDPDRARQVYRIPEHSRARTGLAIGHVGDVASLPEAMQERDRAPRTRKPLGEFVFGSVFGKPAVFVP
jgi:nitroreductase